MALRECHNQNTAALVNSRQSVCHSALQSGLSPQRPDADGNHAAFLPRAVLEGGCPFHSGWLKPNLQERTL